jgi:DNA-binding XRE family transcriptional regulator
MNSALRERFARLGPVRAASPERSFSEETVPVLLRRTGAFRERITVARRLRASGVSLRAAHAAITRLASDDWAVCEIPVDGGIDALARDLAPLDVEVRQPHIVADPAAYVAGVRERHGLSQREFAAALGLDVRTLQNWEQGRNRPDAAVLSLITLFDRDPALVEAVVFEPVP